MRILLALGVIIMLAGCSANGPFIPEERLEKALKDYNELGLGYLENKNYAKARFNFERAIFVSSNFAPAWQGLALVYQETGETELAEESFQRAISSDSSFTQARNNYAWFLLKNGRLEDALEEYMAVSEDISYSGRAQGFIGIGITKVQLDNLVGAKYAFRKAEELNPNLALASLYLSTIYLREGKLDLAKKYISRYRLVVDRDSVQSISILLSIAIAQDNKIDIIKWHTIFKKKFPSQKAIIYQVDANIRK